MPDFFHVPHPTFSPTECVLCGSSTDLRGFVNGGRELVPYGHLWICGTCGLQIGDRFGMLAPEQVQALEDAVVQMKIEVDRLEHELAAASDQAVLSIKDLRKVMKETATA